MNRLANPGFKLGPVKNSARALCLGASLLGLTAITLLPTGTAAAQSLAATARSVQGKVYASTGGVTSGAVVYLKDLKSLEIKTFISGQDGGYRFGQLGSQDDYQLWAEAGGHKSKSKNISSFDAKKNFTIDLHIEDK